MARQLRISQHLGTVTGRLGGRFVPESAQGVQCAPRGLGYAPAASMMHPPCAHIPSSALCLAGADAGSGPEPNEWVPHI